MVDRIGKTVLVDTSFISSVKIEKLETFLNLFDKSDRSFIVSEEMLRELGDAKKGIVEKWLGSLGSRGKIIDMPFGEEDVKNPRYNPKGKLAPDKADIAYKKWLDTSADRGTTYTILTNDKELAEFGRDLDHVKPVGRTASFAAHDFLLSDEARAAERAGDTSFKKKYNTFAFDPDAGLANGMSAKERISNKFMPSAEAVKNTDFHDLPQDRLQKISEGMQVPNDGVNEPERNLKKYYAGKFLEGLGAIGEITKDFAKKIPGIGLGVSLAFFASDYAEASTLYEENPDDC